MTARRGSLAISGTDKASRTCTCLGRGGRRAAHVCGLRPLADCSLCLCRHGATARACNAAPPASRTGLARLEIFSCAVREGYYLCEEPQKVGLDPRVRRGKEWRGVKAAQGESRTRRRRTRRCMGCRARCGRSDQSQVVAFVFTCDALGPPAPRSMGRHSHRRRAVAGGWTAGQSLFSAQ